MNNKTLIDKAASVVRAKQVKAGMIGDVGSALLAENGKVYLGVCLDVGSNTVCAEQNAIGNMMVEGESKIVKIVAVWKDKQGKLFVIPPCGNCRQYIKDIDNQITRKCQG